VDLYTKSFMANEDPYRSPRLPLVPRLWPRRVLSSFSFAPIPCPKPAVRHVSRSPLDPRGKQPSGNLANTDVSGVYTRRATNHSTLHAALTFHPRRLNRRSFSPSSASSAELLNLPGSLVAFSLVVSLNGRLVRSTFTNYLVER